MSTIATINQAAAESLAARLPSMGYIAARVLPDGSVAALVRLISTRAICLGCTEEGWSRRFCFKDQALADQRFAELVTEDDVPAGFVARRWA